jgi:hypothetical protein
MNFRFNLLSFVFLATILLSSCSDDDDDIVLPKETKTFRLTLKNAINYLNVKKIGTDPLTTTGEYYEINFKATKGTYLSFANMFAQSNDWFFATEDTGIKLWDGEIPKTGDISNYVRVFDAGSEEDEAFLTDFSNTVYTAPNQSAPNTGPADDDSNVRDTDRNILDYLNASLTYNDTSNDFTLKIVKANRDDLHNPGYITPGILVVHTQSNALFQEGESLNANGLESLVEDGSSQVIYDWINETGTDGAPLRLSSSYSVLSPGVVYSQGEQSPLFTKGEAAISSSGLEQLAEDGNVDIAYTYLNGLENVTAVKSSTGAAPGESMTFDIEVPIGDRLNFATMFVSSNDWFISYNQVGIELYNEDGSVKSSIAINKNYLYDAGTELDQTVGLGDGQPMNGNNAVAEDSDTAIRRVIELEDVQFGKGVISSTAGVTQNNEVRGGYNLVELSVELIN